MHPPSRLPSCSFFCCCPYSLPVDMKCIFVVCLITKHLCKSNEIYLPPICARCDKFNFTFPDRGCCCCCFGASFFPRSLVKLQCLIRFFIFAKCFLLWVVVAIGVHRRVVYCRTNSKKSMRYKLTNSFLLHVGL